MTVFTIVTSKSHFFREARFVTPESVHPPLLFSEPRKGATPSQKNEPLSSRSILLSRRVTIDALTP